VGVVRIERTSERKRASNAANSRKPRPGYRKADSASERAIIDSLRIVRRTLPACVALAVKIINNDAELGGVPLHLRMEMLKDFMDRGGMPRRTEARVEQQTALSWDEYPFAEEFRLPREGVVGLSELVASPETNGAR